MSISVSALTTSTTTILQTSATSTLPPTGSLSLSIPSITNDATFITAGPFPPMTTHWSRPISCTWTYVVDNAIPPGASNQIAWLDLEPHPGASTLSCYPDGMFFDGHTGIFSPATCPNGWTTVSVSVNTDQDPEQATTTALCCSSEYDLVVGGHCLRTVPTVLAVPIVYNTTAATYEVLTNSTTTLYGAKIAVNTIRALFREIDKPLLGLTNEDAIEDESEDDKGLSLGAKIGIGIGVPIFAVMVIGAVVLAYMRRRDHKRNFRLSNSLHEMDVADRRQGDLYLNPQVRHTGQASSPRAEPTPTYVASDRSSLDDDSEAPATDHEISTLKAQKAAIQRRIDKLERVAVDESPAEGQNG